MKFGSSLLQLSYRHRAEDNRFIINVFFVTLGASNASFVQGGIPNEKAKAYQ